MTKRISIATLESIAGKKGPCLTVVVPDHHPGMPEASQRNHIRTLVKAAKQRAVAIPTAAWPPDFENPLEELATSLPTGGGPGLAIYRTPDSLESFAVEGDSAKAVLASHPYVMPLLTPAYATHNLVVLGLSSKHLKLLEYVDGACKQIDLPAGIPTSMAVVGQSHSGGEQGENRTPAGSSAGNMAGVRFGTGGARETAREAMEHYCALIDQGLRPMLHNRPLLLMGVKEEIAAYRRVSHYDFLMHAEVDGNIETFTPAHIATLASKAALGEYQRLGERTYADFREMRDRARTANDAHEVLKAAAAGRVHKLVARGGTELLGPLDADLNNAHLPSEDLVNAAVVETLRHGGQVYLLPAEQMPITESVCAILRY